MQIQEKNNYDATIFARNYIKTVRRLKPSGINYKWKEKKIMNKPRQTFFFNPNLL